MLLHEPRCGDRINRVGQMVTIGNDSILANQIQSEAERLHFAGWDVREGPAFERIAKYNLDSILGLQKSKGRVIDSPQQQSLPQRPH